MKNMEIWYEKTKHNKWDMLTFTFNVKVILVIDQQGLSSID